MSRPNRADRVSRFQGQITGLGSTSGVRVVVGRWADSPLGPFADVMVEDAAGRRFLLAPRPDIADYVSSTYGFDEVVLGPVAVSVVGTAWRVSAPGLEVEFALGARTGIGRLLRLVPRPLAAAPVWLALISPIARLLLKGVSTRGSAGGGRTEFYGASDVHAVTALSGQWHGQSMGELADVHPPVRFGFGSTPRRPTVTALVTTIRERR